MRREGLYKVGRYWYADLRHLGLGRVSTHCTDKLAAKAMRAKWEREAADPASAAQASATLEGALAAFLDLRREQATVGEKAEATVGFYEQKAGVLLRVLGEECRLSEITAKRMDEYVTQRRGEKVSEHSIRKEIITLRCALKLAKRRGEFPGDLGEILPAISDNYKPRERALSKAEVRALLVALPPDAAARLAFAVGTTAELGAIDRAHDTDIRWSIPLCEPHPVSVRIRGTKRETRDRVVPLVAEWQRSLVEYAWEHAAGEGGALFSGNGTEWRQALRLACKRTGVPHCSPNDLRRTCATWLRAEGLPVELLSPVLGHADGRMAERVYARLSPAALRARMEAALGVDCANLVPNPGTSAALPDTPEGANPLNLAPRAGFEPATRGLTGPAEPWPVPMVSDTSIKYAARYVPTVSQGVAK